MERTVDTSIRVKVTNGCQWTCNFCHNEGTELPDNNNGINRVSIFLDPDVKSLPPVEDITVDDASLGWISSVKGLGIDEIHLTGGEPTLHSSLPKLIGILVDNGIKVKMTTNGQTSPNRMRQIIEAGLSGVNFSILSLDSKEFLTTQNPPNIPGLDPIKWASRMIEREKGNILLAKDLGIDVKINTAVLGEDDYKRVDTVREFATQHGISLVLLPIIGDRETSQDAVFDYAEMHGQFLAFAEKSNNSNSSRIYQMDDGIELRAKYLRTYHPEVVCGGCEHNGKSSCVERFYGPRMEFRARKPYVRLCVQKTNSKTVMPLSEFMEKDINSQL